jgi:hypothetical protein
MENEQTVDLSADYLGRVFRGRPRGFPKTALYTAAKSRDFRADPKRFEASPSSTFRQLSPASWRCCSQAIHSSKNLTDDVRRLAGLETRTFANVSSLPSALSAAKFGQSSGQRSLGMVTRATANDDNPVATISSHLLQCRLAVVETVNKLAPLPLIEKMLGGFVQRNFVRYHIHLRTVRRRENWGRLIPFPVN